MNILITGGTGFVGTHLAQHLNSLGYQVTCLASTATSQESGSSRIVRADTTRPGDWQALVPEHEAIINLAGRSVFHLWNGGYKQQIRDSRILTTSNLVSAMESGRNQVLISTSAAGYYGDGGDQEKTESSAPGKDFLALVCSEWESAALAATDKGCRVCLARLGVVLDKGGGAVATMKTPFKFGLGGPIGNGHQWFPWIHLQDVLRAIVFLLEGDGLSGPFNFTAPGNVRQKAFAAALGKAMGRPAVLPAPAPLMRLVLGEFGRSLLQGQRVVPQALMEKGFTFEYPELTSALGEIIDR
ncbi:MAG: TIGR01777 family protein [Deltaproteobacteria bacterium]|nr:MAG: TIGR01777 family protein [Deltaproteobacteria bacterium]